MESEKPIAVVTIHNDDLTDRCRPAVTIQDKSPINQPAITALTKMTRPAWSTRR